MSAQNLKNSVSVKESVEVIWNTLAPEKSKGATTATSLDAFDFNKAIQAHIDWKMKLSKYLMNPDGSLNADTTRLDNKCALGGWLYGSGLKIKDQFPNEYEELRAAHAEFHKMAGNIIELINRGDKDKAQYYLRPGGEYMSISERTVSLIQKIKELAQGTAKAA
ncbi:MAG: CZB domain-containing protein [Bdellovibrionaceae bacterium]|nr:CZB domain-containing protein [Pseudobdellovibrionaceae bacterium]